MFRYVCAHFTLQFVVAFLVLPARAWSTPLRNFQARWALRLPAGFNVRFAGEHRPVEEVGDLISELTQPLLPMEEAPAALPLLVDQNQLIESGTLADEVQEKIPLVAPETEKQINPGTLSTQYSSLKTIQSTLSVITSTPTTTPEASANLTPLAVQTKSPQVTQTKLTYEQSPDEGLQLSIIKGTDQKSSERIIPSIHVYTTPTTVAASSSQHNVMQFDSPFLMLRRPTFTTVTQTKAGSSVASLTSNESGSGRGTAIGSGTDTINTNAQHQQPMIGKYKSVPLTLTGSFGGPVRISAPLSSSLMLGGGGNTGSETGSQSAKTGVVIQYQPPTMKDLEALQKIINELNRNTMLMPSANIPGRFLNTATGLARSGNELPIQKARHATGEASRVTTAAPSTTITTVTSMPASVAAEKTSKSEW